jgi:hypothetical protein
VPCYPWDAEELELLSRHAHKLEYIDVSRTAIFEPQMAALTRFPLLSQLELTYADAQALQQLRLFPKLTQLALGDSAQYLPLTASNLEDALTGCGQLVQLTLSQKEPPMHSSDLATLQHVPRLTGLRIDQLRADSFDFLQHVPQLAKLTLRGQAANASLLQAILTHTPQLTRLECSSAMFSDDVRFLLQRAGHKHILPQLKKLKLLD